MSKHLISVSPRTGLQAALALSVCLACSPAWSQTKRPSNSTSTSTEEARAALAKKDGEGETTKLLEDSLTATDRQYSLLRKRKKALTWDLSYAYTGLQQLKTAPSSGALGVQNLKSHSVTNSLALDYGLRDNLTANVTVPLVSRYSDSEVFRGAASAVGDVSIGARFQPFPSRADLPSVTLNAAVRLPTGRSPFKTIDGQGISSGAGYASATLGINASKIIDPVALFGSVNLTVNRPATGLYQLQGDARLTRVAAGPALGWGAGFAYAMSYKVSTTLSFQQTVSGGSTLSYVTADGSTLQRKSSSVSSALVNVGLGVRVSPVTTLNYSVGIGLTSDSPDFTFGVNVPLAF